MRTLHSGEFHDTCRTRDLAAGVRLAESEYEPHRRLPVHAHETAFFSLILRGSFEERLDSGSRCCMPTELVFYAPHSPHSEIFGEAGGRAFNVELSDGWMSRLAQEGSAAPEGTLSTRDSTANWLATRLYHAFRAGGPELEVEEAVLEIMAALSGHVPPGSESAEPLWLGRVRDMIHERFAEVLRVGDLATEAGVHPVHLARVFRARHGCTLGAYQRRLRIEHACARLACGDESLSQIALHTGFCDQAHFTRRFKELTGLSPGRYRSVVAA